MRLILIIMLFSVLHAAQPIGKVVAAEGSFKAANRGQLEQSADVYVGDVLVTGSDGRGQVLFLDGTMIIIAAASKYIVKAYSSSKFHTTLEKGGVQFLSGSIAKDHPDGVEINTPSATIGIRGTQGDLNLVNGVLYGGCTLGSLLFKNRAGSIQIGPNFDFSYVSIASMHDLPAPLTARPDQLNSAIFGVPKGGMPLQKFQKLQPSMNAPIHNGVCQQTSEGQ